MRDILRDSSYGNYAASEYTNTRESEQAKTLQIVVDLEEKLRNASTDKQKALFRQYDDVVAELASISREPLIKSSYIITKDKSDHENSILRARLREICS